MCARYQIKDYGRNNEYLLTNTPSYKRVFKIRGKLKKRIKKHPNETFLIVWAFAGHGMQVNGRQALLINTWDRKTAFYCMWVVETEIRTLAKDNHNTYSVALFACCREIHSTQKHNVLFGGTEQQALAHFDVLSLTELTAEVAETKAAKADAKKKLKQQLDNQISQHKAAEEERIQQSGKFQEGPKLTPLVCNFYNNKIKL